MDNPIKLRDSFGEIYLDNESIPCYLKIREYDVSLTLSTTIDIHNEYYSIRGYFNGIGNALFINCFKLRESLQFIREIEIISQFVISGFKGPSSYLEYDRLTIDLSDAADWFQFKFFDENFDVKKGSLRLAQSIQKSMKIPLWESCTIEAYHPFHYETDKKVEIRRKISLRIILKTTIPFKELILLKGNFQRLISYLSNRSFSFIIENVGCRPGLDGEKLNQYTVFERPKPPYHPYMRYDSILFKELPQNFDEIVYNWFSNVSLISIVNRAISRYNHKAIDPQDGFLNVCFALEGFHKHYFNAYHKVYYSKRLRELNDLVTKLNRRLSEDYIEKAVNTRNYHVHTNEDDSNIFLDSELYEETNRLDNFLKQLILNKCLLKLR